MTVSFEVFFTCLVKLPFRGNSRHFKPQIRSLLTFPVRIRMSELLYRLYSMIFLILQVGMDSYNPIYLLCCKKTSRNLLRIGIWRTSWQDWNRQKNGPAQTKYKWKEKKATVWLYQWSSPNASLFPFTFNVLNTWQTEGTSTNSNQANRGNHLTEDCLNVLEGRTLNFPRESCDPGCAHVQGRINDTLLVLSSPETTDTHTHTLSLSLPLFMRWISAVTG